jgi:hypothetical protein
VTSLGWGRRHPARNAHQNLDDRVDNWAVDFDYESRREFVKVPLGSDAVSDMLSAAAVSEVCSTIEYEENGWGGYIFENEWQLPHAKDCQHAAGVLQRGPHTLPSFLTVGGLKRSNRILVIPIKTIAY